MTADGPDVPVVGRALAVAAEVDALAADEPMTVRTRLVTEWREVEQP